MRPATIVHCDWSVHAAKRWRTTARMLADGSYAVEDPAPVGALETLFRRVRAETPTGSILAGFDFPIGVPRQYSARARITRFPDALLCFGQGEWELFYEAAESANQISLARPFYPKRPGGTKKQHLIDGLGLRSARELLRECDHATRDRGKACELFWTLGANQVGSAAIKGWRYLLAPALRKGEIVIWPFDGDLGILLESARIIVAETYPTEIYGQLGLTPRFGKRRREGRKSQARSIRSWCNQNGVTLAPKLAADIADGFGETKVAEDIFDSVIGLLGMIKVACNLSDFAIPADPELRAIEGWILGLGAISTNRAFEGASHSSIIKKDSGAFAGTPKHPLATSHSRLCPACKQKLFARWPWGWDSHAAHTCRGVDGDTLEERKRLYKERYLR